MRLLIISFFILSFNTLASAADQFVINHTKLDVTISFVTCVTHYIVNEDGSGGDVSTRCNQEEKVVVPAMKKIRSPWPDGVEGRVPIPPRSYDYNESYLTGMASPSGKFEPIKFMSREKWDATCRKVEYPSPPGCGESPIYLSRDPNSFAASASSTPGRGGAWVIEELDAGFISMNFHPLGASHMRS